MVTPEASGSGGDADFVRTTRGGKVFVMETKHCDIGAPSKSDEVGQPSDGSASATSLERAIWHGIGAPVRKRKAEHDEMVARLPDDGVGRASRQISGKCYAPPYLGLRKWSSWKPCP